MSWTGGWETDWQRSQAGSGLGAQVQENYLDLSLAWPRGSYHIGELTNLSKTGVQSRGRYTAGVDEWMSHRCAGGLAAGGRRSTTPRQTGWREERAGRQLGKHGKWDGS